MLVLISGVSLFICDRFHARRANSDKISTFEGIPSLTFSFEENPFT